MRFAKSTYALLAVLLVRDALPGPLPFAFSSSCSMDILRRFLSTSSTSSLCRRTASALRFSSFLRRVSSATISVYSLEWLKRSGCFSSSVFVLCQAAFLKKERFFGGAAELEVGSVIVDAWRIS